MKRQKGQALIEFILILPVLLMIITCMFDIGSILYTKYKMNQTLDTVSEIFLNQGEEEANNYAIKEQVKLKYQKNKESYEITVSKKQNITTPGLNKVLGNPYIIEETKIVYPLEIKNEETNDINPKETEENNE